MERIPIAKRNALYLWQFKKWYPLENTILKEGEQVGEEGCLSLPGKVAVVKRPDHVICEAFDEDMNPITVEGFGLFARALCHETDHLDGILYPDVAEEPARDVTMEEVE